MNDDQQRPADGTASSSSNNSNNLHVAAPTHPLTAADASTLPAALQHLLSAASDTVMAAASAATQPQTQPHALTAAPSANLASDLAATANREAAAARLVSTHTLMAASHCGGSDTGTVTDRG